MLAADPTLDRTGQGRTGTPARSAEVKKTLSCAMVALSAIVALTIGSQVEAQAPAGRPALPGVRIIDLKKIFDNYERFKDETGALKREVSAREEQLKGLRDEMKKLDDLRKDQQAGSNEAKEIEVRMVRIDNEHRSQLTLGKKEFLEKEAKIYFNVYREVLDEVKLYCRYEGVSLVLRFNNEPAPGPEDPQGVLKELNKSVVHYDPSIDITGPILGELNRRWLQRNGQATKPNPTGTGVPKQPLR
jgi:Skp family chaperone for outer membrane proteins